MTTEVVLPLDNYSDTTHEFGPVDIADSDTLIEFVLLRCTALTPDLWPDPETKVTTWLEFNIGNGWQQCLMGEAWGGVSKNKYQVDIPADRSGIDVPTGTNRQVRGRIAVENGPLRTECTVEHN